MRTGQACTRNPVTIDIDSLVLDAARQLREQHIGDLIVTEGGQPVAILTDRDIAISVVAQAPEALSSLAVRDVLPGGELVTAHVDEPMWKTLKRMRDRGIRRMPVVEDDGLVGILTVDDVVAHLAEWLSDVAALVENQPAVEFERRR
jgi:CBS domain-containing protein